MIRGFKVFKACGYENSLQRDINGARRAEHSKLANLYCSQLSAKGSSETEGSSSCKRDSRSLPVLGCFAGRGGLLTHANTFTAIALLHYLSVIAVFFFNRSLLSFAEFYNFTKRVSSFSSSSASSPSSSTHPLSPVLA